MKLREYGKGGRWKGEKMVRGVGIRKRNTRVERQNEEETDWRNGRGRGKETEEREVESRFLLYMVT